MKEGAETPPCRPGLVVIAGSGETAPVGRQFFARAFRDLGVPVHVAILETPAGFELNSEWVARQVAEYLEHRLQNYRPRVDLIPARKRGTAESPDEPEIVAGLHGADMIYLGAGSPTYATRQLRGSLAWRTLVAMHRLGARIVLASAATLAVGAHTLPVYEVYKVGEEPRWERGLDLLGPFGLELAVVPHWNNTNGGANLDTSRCFLGRARFDPLLADLPSAAVVVGIEEHTALALDLGAGRGEVIGRGAVSLWRDGVETRVPAGDTVRIDMLGTTRMPDPNDGLPPGFLEAVRRQVDEARAARSDRREPDEEVRAIVARREAARTDRDWPLADRLRAELAARGWDVRDTSDGPVLEQRS